MNYETIKNIAKKMAMKTGTHTQVPVPMTIHSIYYYPNKSLFIWRFPPFALSL